jgi:hypothetical protein
LLKVTLTAEGTLQEVRVLREGHGVYFGLAQSGSCLFVAERNLDINKRPVTQNAPENAIRLYLRAPGGGMFRTPVWYGSEMFDDLHQIAFDRQNLFVTSGRFPFLFRHSIWGRGEQCLNLADAVPAHLQRTDVEGRDAYHFNSVSVDEGSLLVLAHNWDQPSFALRLSLEGAREGRAVCTATYEDIGSCCHDILAVKGALWCLDSGGSALVRIDPENGSRQRFVLTSQMGDPFPRGLGLSGDQLLVSYGFNSEDRAARMESGSMLALFDLKRHRFVEHIALGAHGNTCAVLPL